MSAQLIGLGFLVLILVLFRGEIRDVLRSLTQALTVALERLSVPFPRLCALFAAVVFMAVLVGVAVHVHDIAGSGLRLFE